MVFRVLALLLFSSSRILHGARVQQLHFTGEGTLSSHSYNTSEGAATLDCMSLTIPDERHTSVALGPQFDKYCGILVVLATMSRKDAELEGDLEAEVPGATEYYLIENSGNSTTIANDDSRIVARVAFGRAKSPSGKQTQAAMMDAGVKPTVECKDVISNAIQVTENYGLQHGHETFDTFWFIEFEFSHHRCYSDAAESLGFKYGVIEKADDSHAKTTASELQGHEAGDQFYWFRTSQLQESLYASHPREANHALQAAIREVEMLEAKQADKSQLINTLGSVIETQKANGGLTEDDLWIKRARRKLAELENA